MRLVACLGFMFKDGPARLSAFLNLYLHNVLQRALLKDIKKKIKENRDLNGTVLYAKIS